MKLIKTICIILFLSISIIQCKKSNDKPSNNNSPSVNNTVPLNAKILHSASFIPYNSYKSSGDMKITQEGAFNYLYFESNFASSQGPDLRVLLSTDLSQSQTLDLGKLIAISGNQVYNIPANTPLSQYKYVLIYCKQASRLFGSAQW